jgi:hypothetical protein
LTYDGSESRGYRLRHAGLSRHTVNQVVSFQQGGIKHHERIFKHARRPYSRLGSGIRRWAAITPRRQQGVNQRSIDQELRRDFQGTGKHPTATAAGEINQYLYAVITRNESAALTPRPFCAALTSGFLTV